MLAEASFTRPVTAIVRQIARAGVLLLLGLLMLGVSAWGALALRYWDHADQTLRNALAVTWGLACLALIIGFLFRRWRWRAFFAFTALFLVLLLRWSAMEPSNNRPWEAENAVLAYADVDGERVTLHNIRNLDYRTETDFTPAYYDRTFDLSQLDTADLFTVYWMGPAIAHTFVSFGFTDGSHVAISIETRRERGQAYSSIAGFFRQYPLYFVVADERDVVRVRTNYRHDPPEHVYLYRLRGSPAAFRRLFREYLSQINALTRHPEWYNTFTHNCTTGIWLMTRVNPGHIPYSWKILLSGHVPEYLYEQGRLDTSVPFEELQRRAYINPLAQAADQAADFSQRIRAGQHQDSVTAPANRIRCLSQHGGRADFAMAGLGVPFRTVAGGNREHGGVRTMNYSAISEDFQIMCERDSLGAMGPVAYRESCDGGWDDLWNGGWEDHGYGRPAERGRPIDETDHVELRARDKLCKG